MTAASPLRSLRHEYELYVEGEIEEYKESVSRSTLLAIGDEAVAALAAQQQFALTELLIWDEVDRIIRGRLRIPTFKAWRRTRLKVRATYRRPEHWGLNPEEPLVRSVPTAATHVVVAGPEVTETTLFLAANGCEVTTVGSEPDVIERIMLAAGAAGLARRVHDSATSLGRWRPESPLHALVCTPAAFDGLSSAERARVFTTLQQATPGGGVHLVRTLGSPLGASMLSLDELCSRYDGWDVSVDAGRGPASTFLARKLL